MPDLFDYTLQERMKSEAPLVARMRLRTLDEYIGQEHIVATARPSKYHRRRIGSPTSS
ncbi:MAG: hypothetical protein WBW94_14950 [Anaerolineales bacterium]